MEADQTAQLRALARWHTSRRAVDQLVEPLLAYGPVAVDRVSDGLGLLQRLLREESSAFEAFVTLVADRPRQEAVIIDLFGRPTTVDAD